MLLFLTICQLSFIMFIVIARHEQYDGSSLYEINVKTRQEIEIINKLVNKFYLDEWSRAVPGRPGYILVSKGSKEVFEISLNAAGINYDIKQYNIIEKLNIEEKQFNESQRQKHHRQGFKISFQTIYTYDEINIYLQQMASIYSHVENVIGGMSIEGRPINYLKISTTNFQDRKKPIIMLQSLIHAREWSTSPITLYSINKLVTEVEPDLLNNFDWIIVPVVNPDGYVHTYTKDRMWRKNRRQNDNMCYGVDLNRNFDVIWGGYYEHTCSEEFHGKSPASEPETRVISDIIQKYKNRIHLFLDIHSFGSIILYGYGNGKSPENWMVLRQVGQMMGQIIDDDVKFNWHSQYIVGNMNEIMYPVYGCASDFAQNVGVPLSYSIELPGYDFFVDYNNLENMCSETWLAIVTAARHINSTNN